MIITESFGHTREKIGAYDLNKVGGVRKTYKQLSSELRNHPAGKAYDLSFQAQLREARIREKRNLENKANNANN